MLLPKKKDNRFLYVLFDYFLREFLLLEQFGKSFIFFSIFPFIRFF